MLTAAQIRAARAAVGWTDEDLAAASGFSRRTIVKLEAYDGVPSANEQTLVKIRRALED